MSAEVLNFLGRTLIMPGKSSRLQILSVASIWPAREQREIKTEPSRPSFLTAVPATNWFIFRLFISMPRQLPVLSW